MLGQVGVAVLDKKRFLIIPSDNLQDATVVSADEQTGLRVSQATANTTVGGLNITLSSEPEAEISGQACISRAGLVDDARFTFVRDGDDLTTDVQFEQSPLVFGARTDLIDTSTVTYKILPKTLVLANGDLLVGWLDSVYKPSDLILKNTVWGGWANPNLEMSVCSAATGEWTALGSIPVFSGSDDTGYALTAFDFVQYRDTGSIHLVTLWTDQPYGNSFLNVFTSDDNGSNWTFRSSSLNNQTYGGRDNLESGVTSCSASLLPSGRLVVVIATRQNVASWASDDRGVVWVATNVITFTNNGTPAHNADFVGASSAIARNGQLVLLVTAPRMDTLGYTIPAPGYTEGDVTRAPIEAYLYVSGDGQAWGGGLLNAAGTGVAAGSVGLLHGEVVLRPDGRIAVLGQSYSISTVGSPSQEKYHWNFLWQRTLAILDPSPASVTETLIPSPYFSSAQNFWHPFHVFQTTNHKTGASLGTQRHSQGFLGGLSAVTWRGTVLVVTSVLEEDLSKGEIDPTVLQRGSLSAHRTAYVTALQERIGYCDATALTSLQNGPDLLIEYGRTYRATWDCYASPNEWGLNRLLGGTAVESLTTADTGYLLTAGNAGDTLSYNKLAMLSTSPSLTASLRMVVRAVSGGKIASRDVSTNWGISNGAVVYGMEMAFEVSGSDLIIHAWDLPGGITLMGNLAMPAQEWVEILLCITDVGTGIHGAIYARPLVGTDSPGVWEELITDYSLTPLPFAAAQLTWGLTTLADTAEYHWKSVHYARPTVLPADGEGAVVVGLQQAAFPYDDTLNFALKSDLTNPGLSNIGTGQDTFMQTPRLTPNPRWLDKGVMIRGAGLATTTGEMTYTSEYVQGALNVLQHPVLKEWRGEDSGGLTKSPEVSMVFGNLKNMRPDALALFGRNTPRIRVQLNDTDVWTSPSVDFVVTDPNFSVAVPTGDQEYGHLWYSDNTLATVFPGSYKIGVSNASPWRKHQFRSQPTGQKFYVSVPAKALTLPTFPFGDHVVYRIKDNTENTLILEHDISQDFNFTNFEISIFSDRVAFSIEDLVGQELLDSVTTGYEFMRVTFEACWHRDADEGFHRLGRLLLGDLADLSGPDFQWNWSRGIQANNTLTQSPAGPSFSNRRGQFKRSFTASKGLLRAAEVAGMEETPLNVTEGSWEEFLNLVERLEVNGQECALLWQGERAVAGSADGQRTADPLELMMVRLASVGAITQQQYSCQPMQLPSDSSDVSVARPWMAIEAIDFREEF